MQDTGSVSEDAPESPERFLEKKLRYVVFCMQAFRTGETIDIRIITTKLKRRPDFPAQFPIQRTRPSGLMTENDASYMFQKFIQWISIHGTTRRGVAKLLSFGNLNQDAVIHPPGGNGDVEGYLIGFSDIEPPESGNWLVNGGSHEISFESKCLDGIEFWDIEKEHKLALLSLLDDIKGLITDALVNAGHEVCFDECFEKLTERLTYQ